MALCGVGGGPNRTGRLGLRRGSSDESWRMGRGISTESIGTCRGACIFGGLESLLA